MNLQSLILFILVGLFCSCKSDSDRWAEIKKTRNIYPLDTISSYDFTALDLIERRWINDAYKNYEFKKYCPGKVEFWFETSIPRVRELLSNDTFQIAKKLLSYLREEGVWHFVGQALSPDQLSVYFYIEDGFFPDDIEHRIKMKYIMTIQDDPQWKLYTALTEKKKLPELYIGATDE